MSVFGLTFLDHIWCFLVFGFSFAYFLHCCCSLPSNFEKIRLYQLFQDLIRYGKTKKNVQRPGTFHIFHVPKRWFFHFYCVSLVWNALLIFFSLKALLLGEHFPAWLDRILRLLTEESEAAPKVPALSVLLVQALLWIHSLRRLLECLLVSVFSDSVINVVQYGFGLGYYVLLGLTAISGHSRHSRDDRVSVGYLTSQLQWYHGLGVLLFLWASLHQHLCLALLAQLRTTSRYHCGFAGKEVTLEHRVPHGDWFELVSCPHYLAELLIYISFSICAGGCAATWWLVVLYLFFNQALAAQLSHEFYQQKFESYPKQRTAFIPYLL